MPWAFFRHVARTVTYTSNGVDHDFVATRREVKRQLRGDWAPVETIIWVVEEFILDEDVEEVEKP
jgi:hypothetical protein